MNPKSKSAKLLPASYVNMCGRMSARAYRIRIPRNSKHLTLGKYSMNLEQQSGADVAPRRAFLCEF